MKIKGISYDFIIWDDCFDIVPKGDIKNFNTLCFVEDLNNLFIAVQKAIENRKKFKKKSESEVKR